MKPNDIFTLAIRLMGMMGIFYMVRHLAHVWHRTGTPHLDDPPIFLFEICLIGLGVCMIIFAPEICRFLTRNKSDGDK